ncbi:MAG: SLC13 family permease [Candidatus Promineifilaceae bacterium]|nr:SLC13 family permease [Candidatus Promineifilaceae bacterium]
MSAAITLTFAVLAVTIILFVYGRPRPDVVALLAVLALLGLDILTLDQALAGFADPTVIMIASLFVVGEGLSRTGITAWAGQQLLRAAGASATRLLVLLMAGAALMSAFVSNTGTVATLMPAVTAAAWRVGGLPSQFLMPLAYAANGGGLLTLTGTPPNIVIANTLTDAGLDTFGYFEFGYVGLPLLLGAIALLGLLGRRLLPRRKVGPAPVDLAESLHELAEDYVLQENLYRLRVRYASPLAGQTLAEAGLGRDYGVTVLRVEKPELGPGGRNGLEARGRRVRRQLAPEGEALPGAETFIRADDVLLIRAEPEDVQRIMIRYNVGVQPVKGPDQALAGMLLNHEIGLAEVLLTPRSVYLGKTVAEAGFARKFNVQVVSVRRRGRPVEPAGLRLAFGDSLLVRGTWEAIQVLRDEARNFVVVGSPEALARQVVELSWPALVAGLSLVGMIVLILSGIVPTAVATLVAAVAMILGGSLTADEAYRSVSWATVILIAGMLPVSTALELTGAAALVANGLVATLGSLPPLVLLAGVFLLTAAFSQVISNTAATVLLAPIVLQTALGLDLSPYPLLMTVAVGASAAFLTPIGTTPNLMVTAPGGYRFGDFVRAGGPLLLLYLVGTVLLVPLIWPF